MPHDSPGMIHPRMVRRHQRWRESLIAIMEPGKEGQQNTDINVGHRLHELRSEQGLSLRSLAEMSGLNFNTLSLIENDKSSPSVSTLQRLAQALKVPISAFFDSVSDQSDVVYQKEGQRPQANFIHGLVEDLGHGLTLGDGLPLLITLEPSADSGSDSIVHTGQEFVFCLEGCIIYTVAEVEYLLEVGDSLIFQAHLPHRWRNCGRIISRSILILCPADENDRSTEQHFKTGRVEG